MTTAEREIIRIILSPTTDGEYRARTNLQVEEKLKGENIIEIIKEQRLKWRGQQTRGCDKRGNGMGINK